MRTPIIALGRQFGSGGREKARSGFRARAIPVSRKVPGGSAALSQVSCHLVLPVLKMPTVYFSE